MQKREFWVVLALVFAASRAWAASGTEGASFLDIPVGAGPAALGSAYSAQATDVYAPVWNPAGLGYLQSVEFSGMHLSYLGPVHYEHLGFVVPLGKDEENQAGPAGLGGSIQYLGTGDLDARDENGNPAAAFTSAFAAYTLAYGVKVDPTLALGVSAKAITEKISDAKASAYAADVGLLYKPTSALNIGAVLANAGSKIKFVDEGDSLPLQARLGATYRVQPEFDISAETVYRKAGLFSGSLGLEYRIGDYFSARAGYNTSRTKELGAGAGVTAGFGLFFWGQEFSYAWVPVGDLGQTHYFSLVIRLNAGPRTERPRLKKSDDSDFGDMKSNDKSDYHNIFDILKNDD